MTALALASAAAAAPPAPHAWGPPSPATILRRAELARNPFLGVGVDLELQVLARETGRELRRARFTLLTHRMDRSLLVMHQADPADPGALLIADDTYWLLLPGAGRPVELALRHVVSGDLSHAGFLRVNLRIRYDVRAVTEEDLDGLPCWFLELEPREQPAPFGRVRYWVAREGLLPARIEYHAPTGELLKTVRFTTYQDTGLGLAPERIEIEDARRGRERAILTLARPRRIDTYMLSFDLRELALLRDAARSLGSSDPLLAEHLVEALRSAATPQGGTASP